MFISHINSKLVLGLSSFIILAVVTAGSITFTAYSASYNASDSDTRNSNYNDGLTISPGSQQPDGVQDETYNIRRIYLPSNDIIYNPLSQTIYASVPSGAGSIGNSLTQVNPKSAQIISSVFIGSEPNRLVLAGDGQTLYTSLNGSGAIRRFDTASQTPGVQFSIGQEINHGAYIISDFAVAPDNPNLLAVARQYTGTSQPEAGVAIFDNGVQRPKIGPSSIFGSDFLAFSNTGSTLFGSSSDGLRVMKIDASGVASQTIGTYFVGGRIKYDNGLIFSSNGQVIDAATKTLLGVFSGAASNAFVSDKAVGRAFYIVRDSSNSSNLILKAFDINTFTPIGSITISNVPSDPASLVRWGANGLAFRTSDNQMFFIQTSLIPSTEPIPTVTLTPTITPTPTPTPFDAFTRQLSLPSNDLIYNSATKKIYASVPGRGGTTTGNSVTDIDPVNGSLGTSISVGSEPNKLAFADDRKTLYVGIDGAASVRKVDIETQTVGLQIPLGNDNSNGALTAFDIAVQPGMPGTVAISGRTSNEYAGTNYSKIAIFDEGVKRTSTAGTGSVEFASPTTLYSGDSGTSGTIAKLALSEAGVSITKTFSDGGYSNLYYENGKLYVGNGKVVDTNTETLIGTFTGSNSNIFTVDSANNRIFFLTNLDYSGNGVIRAFELDTFRPAGFVKLQYINGGVSSLVRWGTNGLAFRTSENQIFLIQSNLISSVEPVPTPTPIITPTPTPTPTNIPTFVRRINLSVNDLVYNESTRSIFASVASAAGAGIGNTIAQILPETGETVSSVFIGSEPNKLAPSDDGHTLYAKLDATNTVRQFDMLTKTAGLQFPLPNLSQFEDMDVMPSNPQTLAVAIRYSGGIIIYDNGVARTNTVNGNNYEVNSVEFSNSASTLYGFNGLSTGFDLIKYSVDNNGVKSVNSVSNLIYGFGLTIKFSKGLIYSSNGRVVNPETQNLIGTFPLSGTVLSGNPVMTIDENLHRIFFLRSNVLTAYDINTFVKIGSTTLPTFDGNPTSLVRWGENGLAFRTTNTNSSSGANNSQLYLIQSELVSSTVAIPTSIQLTAPTFTSYENNQTINISVTRTGNISVASSVNYATSDGTATAGSDYTAVSGTLNFAAGESSKYISVPIFNDNIYEGNETFNLKLGNATNSTLTFPNLAVITIFDDDYTPNFTSSNIIVSEPTAGNTANAVFTVRLSNPTTQTVTINYATANGTAIAGADYVATSGTLTFNPLETTKTVSVIINGDNINEADETFSLILSNAVNATLYNTTITAVIKNFNPVTARRTLFDFDGDKKADISVFRPSNGVWYLQNSTAGFSAHQFGIATDKLVPADYDGDGKADIAVWRDGTWYLMRSSQGFIGIAFGQAGDIPVPGDYDGDGKADIAVYRPSNGYWYVQNSVTNQFSSFQFGISSDKPVNADYDGDGKCDYAVYRPDNGVWYILQSRDGFVSAQFGISTDKPMVGDFDGDGKFDKAVYRASVGSWYISGSTAGFIGTQFGLPTDIPTAADYDGDGKTDIAVFRPDTGNWYESRSLQGFIGIQFGSSTDIPIANSFVP